VAERIEMELANSPMPVGLSYGIVEAKEVFNFGGTSQNIRRTDVPSKEKQENAKRRR